MSISTSPSIRNIVAALNHVQQEIGTIETDMLNDATGSSYASLPHILDNLNPQLQRYDLVVWFAPTSVGDCYGVTCRLDHLPSGEWIETSCLMPVGLSPTPHQVLGSQTYARRAIMQSLFNLRVRDDDGNVATGISGSSPLRLRPAATERTLADPPPAATPAPAPAPAPAAAAADVAPDAGTPDAPAAPAAGPAAAPPVRGGGRPRRVRVFASEAELTQAKELLAQLKERLGVDAAQKFLASRIMGTYIATAAPEQVRAFVVDATAFLVSAAKTAAPPPGETSPAAA